MTSDKNSGRLFLKSKDSSYTYNDLNKFSAFFSSYLQQNHISKDQTVGLLAQSCDEIIFAVAACWKLGISFVCFDPNGKKQKLKQQIRAINPALIFIDNCSSDNLFERKVQLSGLVDIKELSKKNWLKETEAIGGARLQGGLHQEETFGYFFTSGTTDEPKIVPLKRRQMLSAAYASTRNLELNKNECWLLCMPLNHIGGISIVLRSLIYGSAIFRFEKFDTAAVSKLLSENTEVKSVSLVPTMLKRLLGDSEFKVHKQFKAILLGGGPVQNFLLKECTERNIPVITSYGMTETCAQIVAGRTKYLSSGEVSAGTIFEPNEVQIRDENGSLLKTNESGIIWLKGPQVFDGYFVDRDSSRSANACIERRRDKSRFMGGWFNTGDFGKVDEKGNLYIKSRRTDLIVTGGENVSPFEVEEALTSLGGIKAAAVIGLPDEEWGQVVAAAVVTEQQEQLSPNELRKKLKAVLEFYKIPKKVVFVNKLPRTATGKMKRRALIELYKS